MIYFLLLITQFPFIVSQSFPDDWPTIHVLVVNCTLIKNFLLIIALISFLFSPIHLLYLFSIVNASHFTHSLYYAYLQFQIFILTIAYFILPHYELYLLPLTFLREAIDILVLLLQAGSGMNLFNFTNFLFINLFVQGPLISSPIFPLLHQVLVLKSNFIELFFISLIVNCQQLH